MEMNERNAKRIELSATQKLNGTMDAIFPLLCPTREYDWIPHWDCEMVYSRTGFAELDCIFKTRFPDQGDEEIWVIDKYQPPEQIQFIRVNRLRAIRYLITLYQREDGTTSVHWKQVVTGLSPEGNEHMEKYTQDWFSELIASLEKMINHYLETGRLLEEAGAKG